MKNKDPDLEKILAFKDNLPAFTGNPAVDKLYEMLMRTLQELAVTREEVRTLQLLLKENGMDPDKIFDALSDQPEEVEARLKAHKKMIIRVIGDLERRK
jgi:hypothetical protein